MKTLTHWINSNKPQFKVIEVFNNDYNNYAIGFYIYKGKGVYIVDFMSDNIHVNTTFLISDRNKTKMIFDSLIIPINELDHENSNPVA